MILDSSILIADERGRFALQEFFAAGVQGLQLVDVAPHVRSSAPS